MSVDESTAAPHLDLNDGGHIPQLGFGVFQVPPEQTVDAVERALRTGYRLLDTAAAYGNEREVGQAIRRSGLDRDEIFLTTKLWNDQQGAEQAARAFEQSLDRLDAGHIDLYLIHWPAPRRHLYVETWEALCRLQEEGHVRSIGVSNFTVENLSRIIEATGVVPAVNQIELHPWLTQAELRRFHAEQRIVTEAWSPLARGGELLRDPLIEQIASRHGRTAAQVILRWHVQLGNVVIPKSVTPARIEENLRLFDFSLSAEDMSAMEQLDRGRRTGPDPATFG